MTAVTDVLGLVGVGLGGVGQSESKLCGEVGTTAGTQSQISQQ